MKKEQKAYLLIGAPGQCTDIAYITGFHAPDPVVCLHYSGRRYLVVSDLEAGRATSESIAGTHVFTTEQLKLRRSQRRNYGAWALALLRVVGVRTIYVPGDFPHAAANWLQRHNICVRINKGALFPNRAVKSTAEIAHIRETQQVAVIAMRAATAEIGRATVSGDQVLLRKGKPLLAEDIQQLIMRVALESNCIARDTIVACGADGADPHKQGEGPLLANTPIVIDIFPQNMGHGYWGDITRTLVRGTASRNVRAMYHAVRAAQQAALTFVKPGVKTANVHACAMEEFVRRGFRTYHDGARPVGFIHGTGHGVGLDIHEAPGICTGEERLKSGNVITIEPGLYYPEDGGMRIEDTIVVTPRGWRYLVPCEKKLEI